MRFSDFCEKFLNAHDLYNRSLPRSVDTLQLALKEVGFTDAESEKIITPLAIRIAYSVGEWDLRPQINVLYSCAVPWWLRARYAGEDWYNGQSPTQELPIYRSYD